MYIKIIGKEKVTNMVSIVYLFFFKKNKDSKGKMAILKDKMSLIILKVDQHLDLIGLNTNTTKPLINK